MTTMRESIKYAEGAVWPAVRDELAAQATPIAIDKLARTKQSRSNVRFVVEATIQTLAMKGLLRTPADADVIGKAVNWYEAEAAGEDDEMVVDHLESELEDAVERLLEEVARPT